jgi:hypothetical protein
MKTDKELTELAAEAAGYSLEWDGDPEKWVPIYYEGKTYSCFDPLVDDGVALRLAMKLGISVIAPLIYEKYNPRKEYQKKLDRVYEESNTMVSVRREIVIAAAKIAEKLQSIGSEIKLD